MILLIDNYDSFVYNLYQYIGEFTEDIKIFRNDEITLEEVKNLNPKGIVISPGPGKPENAKVSLEIIEKLGDSIPILGVCLGHQGIGYVYNSKVIKNKEIVHGKTSKIYLKENKLFKGIDKEIDVMRYHSLIIEKDSLSEELVVLGTLEDGTIMAIKHREKESYGVQFHPESVGTIKGKKIIENFVRGICDEC
ncbi:MAG: anthranilate synthase component II [Sarcina sp.]